MAAKRFTDIEIALRWAYRDELPKRDYTAVPRRALNERVWSPYLAPAGFGETSPMFREGVGRGPSGGYADGWSRDPGYPAALGGPHPDAIAIEAAVKALSVWWGHGFGPDDVAGLKYGMEHMDVDHLQAGVEAVAAMPAIVAVHARAGTGPRWSRELPEPFPDRGGNGKPKVLIDEIFIEKFDKQGVYYEPIKAKLALPTSSAAPTPPPGDPRGPSSAITFRTPVACPPTRKDVYREGAYCPLVYRPRPEGIVAERAEYAAWRMGLEILAGELAGRLVEIAPLAPAAPWRPWAGEIEAHGRPPELFKALRNEPHRRETREQAAAKRRARLRRQLEVRTESQSKSKPGNFPVVDKAKR